MLRTCGPCAESMCGTEGVCVDLRSTLCFSEHIVKSATAKWGCVSVNFTFSLNIKSSYHYAKRSFTISMRFA